MVLVVAGGVAARGGVIIKTANVIERGLKVTDVIFDKMGTLTEPCLEVVEEFIVPTEHAGETAIRSMVLAMVKTNKHPVSEVVAKALEGQKLNNSELADVASIPGHGVEAELEGIPVRAGNAKWLLLSENSKVLGLASQGLTMLCVKVGGELGVIYGLKCRRLEGASEVVRELHRHKISVHIVSGDARRVVEGSSKVSPSSLNP